MMDSYSEYGDLLAKQTLSAGRLAFIKRTYAHLAGAILLFVALEVLLLNSPVADAMMNFLGGSSHGWLMILGVFIIVGWGARAMATNLTSINTQYAGLALYTVAEAIIFVPLLYVAQHYSSPDVIPAAGVMTLALFGGLTLVVFTTRKDFSFLGPILAIGGMVALGLIVCACLFGFSLGLVFSGGMVLLACAAILYDTSKILHHYPENAHVAASLELFASVALLFWYVLRILMSLDRR